MHMCIFVSICPVCVSECMCVQLCILHAYVHMEDYMVACVCSGQGGVSCEAIYVYEQMWAPQPQSHQSTNSRERTLLPNMGCNCTADLTGLWSESLKKTPDYFPCPQDDHLSSDMITTWPTCQQNKTRHSFH